MFKRALLILLVCVALTSVFPAAAQSDTPEPVDFIPADFAGFVQLQMDDSTIQNLNIIAFVTAQLQPNRISVGENGAAFDDMISLNALFDVSNASFEANILPWLGDEMVIAYRDFNGQLGAVADDALLILPTVDMLETASALSGIIGAQDLLERQEYRGITVYVGDKTTIALTSLAIFIGPTDLVEAALDVQAGVSDALTASPVYHTLRNSIDEDTSIFAYVDADHVLPAVSGLLGGQPNTQPLLAAFGGALGQMRGESDFTALLLNNGFDGAAAGVEITVDVEQIYVNTTTVFHTTSAPAQAETSPNQSAELVDMVPQNAILVGNGTDAEGLVYNVLTALPMSNFAREILGGLPIQTVGTTSEQITVPDAAQVQNAVNGYLTMMERFNDFSLQTDFIDYLSGDYMIAMLPRPNNPVPVLNIPFDLLIVARVNDEAAALAGAETLLQTMLNLEPLDTITIESWDFNRLGVDSEPVVSLGADDGLLIIATGEVPERALNAQKGDNRLTNQTPWQVLSETATPDIYLDSFVFLNTFFPPPGGQVASQDNRVHFGLYQDYLGSGVYELKLTAIVPNSG